MMTATQPVTNNRKIAAFEIEMLAEPLTSEGTTADVIRRDGRIVAKITGEANGWYHVYAVTRHHGVEEADFNGYREAMVYVFGSI